jgi:hypothetical protein
MIVLEEGGWSKLRSSFNVVSAFTKGLMMQTLNVTSQHLKKILTLLHDVLNPSNFSFSGQICNGFVAFSCVH